MTDAVEAVSYLELVKLVRIVWIRLCTLNNCEAMPVDMINPRDWSKRVCGSIVL